MMSEFDGDRSAYCEGRVAFFSRVQLTPLRLIRIFQSTTAGGFQNLTTNR